MTLTHLSLAMILAMASGCAALFPEPVLMGDTQEELISKRGQPTRSYQVGNERVLEYAGGPWGQTTWMARLGAEGRVASFEQVLTDAKFGTVEVGKTTRNEILVTFGAPHETSYLPLKDYEVWTYAYKESGVWNSLMHVHFDRAGVVQMMLRGPDPRFEPERRRLRF
jgi:hypothetical protein